MSRGVRQPLVESILVGSFRPDRQGRLLLEETLPAVCPLEDASDGARQAWRNLATAQASYRDSGAVNPWGFASLVRHFHSAQRGTVQGDEWERWRLVEALRFGPWRLTGPDCRPAGSRRYGDKELRAAWEWARHEPASTNFPEWDEGTWAHRRFVLGESGAAAFTACRQLQRERFAATIPQAAA